ncbi:MAG TPA: family 43 glycosylhydrolase [Bacteroidales bacterium]|nr:family 43 glycosylhydrolase [Bacteroidales bacterium]
MKTALAFFSLVLAAMLSSAQNPISPPGVYLADPTARVWNDGKMYIYGSVDESCDYYCSHRHYALVSADMLNWQLVKNIFTSKDEGDGVPYNETVLFAPSAAYKDGVYYLYYCQPDHDFAEGVAISESPIGPFTGGVPIDPEGYNQIDPDVFIDDDGTAYYLWGQFTLKMAKLKPTMKELRMETITDSILTEDKHHFHEGAFMTKINGLYYLVYADISRADIPTCLGYATSISPLGPYQYRGVIIDNNHCNPRNWNNHGSIAAFNGQWYVFYHRSTHGCNKMRKACVEPIEIHADGSIPEVEMTSQGAGPPLLATSRIEAEQACILNGNLRIEQFGLNNEKLTNIYSGDKAAFKYIDFGKGVDSITIMIKPGNKGGKMMVSIDKPWHQRLALIEISPETSDEWQTQTFPVKSVNGVHALWLHFYGDNDEMLELDWFSFSGRNIQTR